MLHRNYIQVFIIIIIAFLPFVAAGQQALNKAVISGKLLGKQADWHELTIKQNAPLRREYRTYKLKVEEDGTFHQLINCYSQQEISIVYKDTYKAIVQPGDSIYLKIEQETEKEKCKLTFEADGKELNRQLNLYLTDYYATIISKEKLNNAYKDKSHGEISRFAKKLKVRISKQQELFKQQVTCTTEMESWLNAQLIYTYYNVLLNYPFNHMQLNKLRRGEWSVPSEYYAFVKEMPDVSDQYYLHSELMDELVRGFTSYSTYAFTQKYGSNGISMEMGNPEYLYMDLMIECTANHPNIKQLVLGDHMHRKLSKNNVALYAELEAQLKENISNPIILDGLSAQYQYLTAGKMHASVQLSTVRATSCHQIIKEIVDQHPSKVIYVDLWATWCGPCIKAMNKAPAIHEKYAGKDISFVYLCLSSKEPDWKVCISKHHLHGNQYWLNGEQSGVVARELDAKSLPQYLLINNGEVVQEPNLLFKPSDPKTFAFIDKLLDED